MPIFEEGDDIVYETALHGKGKGIIAGFDEKREAYLIIPNKKTEADSFFAYEHQLIGTPF